MSDAAPRVTVRPRLSVIICIYDMPREAPRTILSAAAPYQRNVATGDYEVIVVDNGSRHQLRREDRDNLPAGVSLVDVPEPRPSPAFAMNWAAREIARGDILLFAIDGARIFSDGLYAATLAAHEQVEDAFVYTLAWHLGPKLQALSTQEGYDDVVEDRLLADADWPRRQAALYDISVLADSSREGYFRALWESNAFSMRRGLFERLGGYDERFVLPGGGLCNLEIFGRYAMRPGGRNVCLLSEGTFHQVHRGSIAAREVDGWAAMDDEHRRLFGRIHERPTYETLYFGSVRPEAVRFMRQSLDVCAGVVQTVHELPGTPPVMETSGRPWIRRWKRRLKARDR